MNKYTFNENYFHNIDTADKAYWFGFICADGCILDMKLNDGRKVPRTVQISLSANDIEHLYKFMKAIDLDKNIYIGIAHNKTCDTKYCRIQVGSSIMSNDLINNGCIQRKTGRLQFPETIPIKYMRDYIRGYFDGNGSVYYCERMQFDKRRNKSYLQKSFVCNFQGTEQFLTKLSSILLERGILCLKVRKGHGNIYSMEFGKRETVIAFYHYLYDEATVYLDRKRDKFINTFKYLNADP